MSACGTKQTVNRRRIFSSCRQRDVVYLGVIGCRRSRHSLFAPFRNTLGYRKRDAIGQFAGLTNKWGTGGNDFSRPQNVRLGNLCHAKSMCGQSLVFQPKADATLADCNVRFWHLADIPNFAIECSLLGVKRTFSLRVFCT